ncbi:GPI mannosyltransferase 4 [Scheffersomyces coipomensis]|uniref:GPI mannosyltransferase 4 n=1 Tax=Scheffersomyces coipomensis TaxID=1788519 RepID=UPI00315C9D6B
MITIPSLNWRALFFISIGLRFFFALSNSYIHPDEHFQSLEVLTNKILGFSTTIPWEFTSDSPARSLGPLYLFYGPLLYFIKLTSLQFTPLQIWYLIRLQNVIIGWLITDFCLHRLLPTKPERVKAIFFTSTSYITLVYQSHLFSNSLETYLLLISILIIDNLRSTIESNPQSDQEKAENAKIKVNQLFWLGVIISIGIFNRVTFPAFLILPSLFILQYIWIHKLSIIILAIGFIIPTILFIIIDTLSFNTSLEITDLTSLDPSQYVITPINNLLYNANYDNLSQHGIHPLYNHIIINLPQILGPSGLLFLFFNRQYWKTTPFLSIISGIITLSLIPHQELRFLIPIIPLACSCFNLYAFSNETTTKPNWKSSLLINSWYLFNIIMAIIMGVYHQGGIVPALDYFHTSSIATPSTVNDQYIQIWWRTYSPPTWFLGDTNEDLQTITLNDENFKQGYNLDENKSKVVFDTMGIEYEYLLELINQLKSNDIPKSIYLITPTATFNYKHLSSDNEYKLVWDYHYHLDMDHLDFNDLNSLVPGLGIYELV